MFSPELMRRCPLLALAFGLLVPAAGLHAQAIVGAAVEGGYAVQRSGAFGHFFDDYNDAFEADLEQPFDGLAVARGFEGGLRFVTGSPTVFFGAGLGLARLRADDATRTRDTGGRSLTLRLNDFLADVELGQAAGLRAVLGTTVRATALRSERRLSTGVSDHAEGPGLSGTYEGSSVNFSAGLSYALPLVFGLTGGGGFAAGLRLAVTYPFYEAALGGTRDLTYFDGSSDRTFPDAYSAQGAPADAKPVRAGMGGPVISLRLSLGVLGAF